jgi:hypothetical protein
VTAVETAKATEAYQPTPLRELIRQQSEAMRAIHLFGIYNHRVEWGVPEDCEPQPRQAARCQ